MLSTPNIKPFAALATLSLALALVGCGNSGSADTASTTTGGASATTTPAGGDAKKQLKLAFVTNNSSDYWTIARKGVEKADKELDNVEVEFQMPTDGTAAGQKGLVDNLLAKNIDGMAISPVDATNQTDMINDAVGKTLVFTQDSDAPTSKRVCYIGTDNKAAGMQLGEELKKALPNGGKVVVFVGKLDAQNAKDRIGGIEEAIKGTKIQIVDKRTDDTDHTKAKSNASDILTRMPDVAALIGIWSYNGPGILSAVEEAGKTGKVKILCFDEETDTLKGVKDGKIDCTIVQNPYEFGYKGIKDMAAYLGGDKSVVPADGRIIIPTRVLHAGDVDAFKADLDKKRAGE